jgi:hypothetical protein
MQNQYCHYFQAYVKPEFCWFVVAILKAEEHVVFTRTLDIQKSIMEFFVPELMQNQFFMVIDALVRLGYMEPVKEMTNRLMQVDDKR